MKCSLEQSCIIGTLIVIKALGKDEVAKGESEGRRGSGTESEGTQTFKAR